MAHSMGKHITKHTPPMRNVPPKNISGDVVDPANDEGQHTAQIAGKRGKPSMAEMMYPSMMKGKGKAPMVPDNDRDGM